MRVPAILSWPNGIPAGQVISEMGAAMDIFPTFLRLAGGDPARYELDGLDILPMVTEGAPTPHQEIFWEMGEQTAVRRGPWKLVLNGQLVEGTAPEDELHLANLDDDMAERHNLKDDYPMLAAELKEPAESWRAGIEERWQDEWQPRINGTTTHPRSRQVSCGSRYSC